jgi:hypothetical protein
VVRSGATGVKSGRVESVAKLPEVFPHALGDKDKVSGCMSVGIRYFEAASGRVVPRGVVGASGADEVKTVAAGEGLRAAGGAAGFEARRPVEEGDGGGTGDDKVAREG